MVAFISPSVMQFEVTNSYTNHCLAKGSHTVIANENNVVYDSQICIANNEHLSVLFYNCYTKRTRTHTQNNKHRSTLERQSKFR